MKPILITQMNTTASMAPLLAKALSHLNIPHVWKKVAVGEDLSAYGGVIMCAVKLNSMAAFSHRYGALYAASQLPSIVMPDDWQVRPLWTGWKPRYLWDYPTKAMRGPGLVANSDALRNGWGDKVDAFIDEMAQGKGYVLFNLFDWGRHELLTKQVTGRVVSSVDLSQFAEDTYGTPAPVHPSLRERKVIVAGLLDPRNDKIGAAWYESVRRDIIAAGDDWSGVMLHGVKGERFKRQPEQHVTDLYSRSWVAVSRPYAHAGSGWWRVRFQQAVAAGCVMVADPKEVGALGPAYQVPLRAALAMTDDERAALVNDQAAAFCANTPPRDEVLAGLRRHLEQAGLIHAA